MPPREFNHKFFEKKIEKKEENSAKKIKWKKRRRSKRKNKNSRESERKQGEEKKMGSHGTLYKPHEGLGGVIVTHTSLKIREAQSTQERWHAYHILSTTQRESGSSSDRPSMAHRYVPQPNFVIE